MIARFVALTFVVGGLACTQPSPPPPPPDGETPEPSEPPDPERWLVPGLRVSNLMLRDGDLVAVHAVDAGCVVERREFDSTVVWSVITEGFCTDAALAGNNVVVATRLLTESGDYENVLSSVDSQGFVFPIAQDIDGAIRDIVGRTDGTFTTVDDDCVVRGHDATGTVTATVPLAEASCFPYDAAGDDTLVHVAHHVDREAVVATIGAGTHNVYFTRTVPSAGVPLQLDADAERVAICYDDESRTTRIALMPASSSDEPVVLDTPEPKLRATPNADHYLATCKLDGDALWITDGSNVLRITDDVTEIFDPAFAAYGAGGANLVVANDTLIVSAMIPSRADILAPFGAGRTIGEAGDAVGTIWRLPIADLRPAQLNVGGERDTQISIGDGWIATGDNSFDSFTRDAVTGDVVIVRTRIDSGDVFVERYGLNGVRRWSQRFSVLIKSGFRSGCESVALPDSVVIACNVGRPARVMIGHKRFLEVPEGGHFRVRLDQIGEVVAIKVDEQAAMELTHIDNETLLFSARFTFDISPLDDALERSAPTSIEIPQPTFSAQFDVSPLDGDLIVGTTLGSASNATVNFVDGGVATFSPNNAGLLTRLHRDGTADWAIAVLGSSSGRFSTTFTASALSNDLSRAIACGLVEGGELQDLRTGVVHETFEEVTRAICIEVDATTGDILFTKVLAAENTLVTAVAPLGSGWIAAVTASDRSQRLWRVDDTVPEPWFVSSPFTGFFAIAIEDELMLLAGSMPARSTFIDGTELPGIAGSNAGVTIVAPRSLFGIE